MLHHPQYKELENISETQCEGYARTARYFRSVRNCNKEKHEELENTKDTEVQFGSGLAG